MPIDNHDMSSWTVTSSFTTSSSTATATWSFVEKVPAYVTEGEPPKAPDRLRFDDAGLNLVKANAVQRYVNAVNNSRMDLYNAAYGRWLNGPAGEAKARRQETQAAIARDRATELHNLAAAIVPSIEARLYEDEGG